MIQAKKKRKKPDDIARIEETSVLPAPRNTTGRARKPISYAVDSDDDDSN